VPVRLIIWGCDEEEEDKEIIPVVSDLLAGENWVVGRGTDENARTIIHLLPGRPSRSAGCLPI